MDYKLIVIISFTFLYGLFEIFMSVRQRRKLKIVKSGDRFSIWILSISIAIGYWISFSIASTQVGRIRYWDYFFALGLILISVGLIIRIKSISTLKQHFTYAVNKIEDHELIEVGLYRNIRHPGYLGQLIIFLGISISLSNWISILSMMIAVLCGYIYRINTEEKFLVAQMGTIYINYQRRTKKLIPKLY
ncbi:MAG: isoprenylcysteine carboxylmethyltransferase family protein [Saprospiraceae bacterium]|nr:isoprenylcysteine carboxylmethyltransferase family protein [Saprospiraceae bacterium]